MSKNFYNIEDRIVESAREIESHISEDKSQEVNFRLRESAYCLNRVSEIIKVVDAFLAEECTEEEFHEKWEKEVRPYFIEELMKELENDPDVQNRLAQQEQYEALRDLFASNAIPAIYPMLIKMGRPVSHEEAAAQAYLLADEMLKIKYGIPDEE